MKAGCGKAGDYAGDPSAPFGPIKVSVSISQGTLIYYYTVNETIIEPNSSIIVYVNGEIIDREGQSGKIYSGFSAAQLLGFHAFTLAIVAPGIDSPDYDPLCGEAENIFDIIEHDFIHFSQHYVCPNRSILENHFGKIRKNFIDVSMKQLGMTVANGIETQLKKDRLRLVGDKLVEKSAGPVHKILNVDDYRYFTQFDKQAFQTNPNNSVPCDPYRFGSKKTAVRVVIPEGRFPISDLQPPRTEENKEIPLPIVEEKQVEQEVIEPARPVEVPKQKKEKPQKKIRPKTPIPISNYVNYNQGYICPNRPIYENRLGKIRKNFIDVSMKQLGMTATRGTNVSLKKNRTRLVGDKLVEKSAGPVHKILNVDDYRYFTQFDKQAFQTNPNNSVPCDPYKLGSKATAVNVNIPEGKFPISDLQPE